MKKITLLVFTALLAVAVRAADAVPVFNATLTMGKENRFVLISAAGKASSFLAVGETFDGYTIKAYDAKTSTLDLERDGKITRVTLVGDAAIAKGGSVAPTKATLADAEEVFRLMRFEEMMSKMLDGQKKAMAPMMQQQMSQAAARMNLSDADKEAFMAFQKKAFDEMMTAIMGPDMKNEMAKAYSEVFTKEELAGLAAFYSTPAGQALVEKTPEVTAKTQAVMMPRMQQSMMKMQQASKDFVAQMMAKNQGGANAAPAPTTPPPAAK